MDAEPVNPAEAALSEARARLVLLIAPINLLAANTLSALSIKDRNGHGYSCLFRWCRNAESVLWAEYQVRGAIRADGASLLVAQEAVASFKAAAWSALLNPDDVDRVHQLTRCGDPRPSA